MEEVKLPLFLLFLLVSCLQWVQSATSSHNSHRHHLEHRDQRPHQNITLAIILPQTNTAYPWAWPRVGPALVRAIDNINADPTLLPDHKLVYLFESSEDAHGFCSEYIAPIRAVDIKFAHNPWAFFGPGCVYTSSKVALFTTHWDIPLVTAGAPAVGFHSDMYSSITNMGPKHRKLGTFALHICHHFGWQEQLLLMFSDNRIDDRPYYFAIEGLNEELLEYDINTMTLVFNESDTPVNYTHLVHTISQSSRETSCNYLSLRMDTLSHTRWKCSVVFVCCSPDTFREFMINFKRAGLPQEEFVFFYIDLFGETLDSVNPQPWARGDQYDSIAKEAFQSVKILTYREPQNPEYKDFVRDLKTDAKRMFNFTVDDSLINIISGGFYDGMMLYAHALNDTMATSGGRPMGRHVTQRMWNRSYHGVTGLVQIDENGDRETDFALWDMTDIDTGKYQIVLVYDGCQNKLMAVSGKTVHWPGGTVPPDVPFCGFENDNPECLASTITVLQMSIIVVLFVIIIILTTSVFIYRKLKLEEELLAQLWRISWEDIQMSNLEKLLRRAGSKFTLSLRGSNYGSFITGDGNFQVFAKTGYYKGNLVAIKNINRKRVELTRNVLFELKHMRDVQNEHLTRFIGACIDHPNICIITEYCPRGSLQDIMENETISLDWMFRYSLINDIVKGMAFLHNSVIVSHGNLKSSNCVVDNRFVLKITDYGLASFRTGNDKDDDAHANYARKLWMAPELLRSDCPPPCGTQQADVYSFGIILQEVALRHGAFYLEGETLSPKEIVDQVTLGEWPYLRPSVNPQIHSKELGQLMQSCWAEQPSERLEFNHIKLLLRQQNRECSTNILDNLLSRMEQYANNLEELVEERTQAYHEERRKAEALLYQILPHSVAEQLKRGETVQAEAFDSVTIYFSDIVGFTAISSESTPMQVVTLLSDLYTCFDAIIDNFDVYKVETIGDAYMVVSGLPVRNGKLHGREIARMALALLHAVRTFKIRHQPDQQLKLRIGIHSGPVCAGVVGLKMPRYCLFGDTVNTSSRLESNGEALKIHVSAATRDVLQEFNCFQLELRGEVEMKGKGKMTTYWLLGETKSQELTC
ncbi:hypothetical protein DPEC_G00353560 [Dallia pectoralis]|uniref:Uncharacterized protein n=1 Tax=Dallia pectoralis TaxID=75939 RepID=A0ACC2F2G7_DALPE|nr:hypothetical protein DPEC_G00353560 [Dallia pectoralis]